MGRKKPALVRSVPSSTNRLLSFFPQYSQFIQTNYNYNLAIPIDPQPFSPNSLVPQTSVFLQIFSYLQRCCKEHGLQIQILVHTAHVTLGEVATLSEAPSVCLCRKTCHRMNALYVKLPTWCLAPDLQKEECQCQRCYCSSGKYLIFVLCSPRMIQ